MPQFGRIDAGSLAVVEREGSAPPAPWSGDGVTVQAVTFEVAVSAALDALPELFARPAPPYARIAVTDYPDSPVGPYREAQLLLSCRYLMLPRQYVVASIVSSPEAAAAIAQHWGYEPVAGTVELTRDGDDFVSTISDPSGLTIRVASPGAATSGTAMIRYDTTVSVWLVDGEPKAQLLSAEPGEIREAWLARATTVEYSGGDRSSPWLQLRSTNPITCTIAELDLERPEPTVIERPSPGGGAGGP